MDGIELKAGVAKQFGLVVPADLSATAVRVGVSWSKPLKFETAEEDAFKIAWSEPFDVKKLIPTSASAEEINDLGDHHWTKTGTITHGRPERGLAAFLATERPQFKVSEPIMVSYGVVCTGLEPGVQLLKAVLPCGAADPENRSWLTCTGPDGNEVKYRGEFISRFAVGSEDQVSLRRGMFVGTTSTDVELQFDFNTPGKYRLIWHYRGGGLPEAWAGDLVSNEIEIEIVP